MNKNDLVKQNHELLKLMNRDMNKLSETPLMELHSTLQRFLPLFREAAQQAALSEYDKLSQKQTKK